MLLCVVFCTQRMVMALMKLSLFLYFFYISQSLVNTNLSGNRYSHKITRGSRSINDYNDEEYLLNTPGCTIPNMWNKYRIEEAYDCNNTCGIRAVHITKNPKNNIIQFIIDESEMGIFFGTNSYECCFQFAYRLPNDRLKYTECRPFKNGTRTTLEHEVITVTCKPKELSKKKRKSKSYEDAHIILKKIDKKIIKRTAKDIDRNWWNVLILGMDTMSRARAIQSMPMLVKYFKENNWLDYRGFHKAGKNTFPNVMNLLSGKKSTTYNRACRRNMSRCNHLMIWSEFKSSGYVTAYGQDDIPDSFRHFNQFRVPPTDHYTRPIMLLGKKVRGNIHCTKNIPTALHILSYANQFVQAYKDEKFFGYFWISSYSHDPNHLPSLLQNDLIQFFTMLSNMGALNDTVIFFIGDHGTRRGKMKIPVQSYYDDRLPMLFMWFPYSFRNRLNAEYKNLELNQHRLTTHCDVHATLWNILKLSDDSIEIIPPEACPKCSSLFEEKSMNRSCEDINVIERWCSCHVLNEVEPNDIAATRVPLFVLSKINNKRKHVNIKTILRHHWYKNEYVKDNTTYYLIAMEVMPSKDLYEAIIKNQYWGYEVLELDTISTKCIYYNTTRCKPAK